MSESEHWHWAIDRNTGAKTVCYCGDVNDHWGTRA